MHEIQLLKSAKLRFATLSVSKSHHNQNMQDFYEALIAVIDAIENEAFLTPAGKRWFKGQLKLYPATDLFYHQWKDSSQGKSKPPFNIVQYQKCMDELDKIIESGVRRYISG